MRERHRNLSFYAIPLKVPEQALYHVSAYLFDELRAGSGQVARYTDH
jgi:hypothetical protein